jgi:hypothetical protein
MSRESTKCSTSHNGRYYCNHPHNCVLNSSEVTNGRVRSCYRLNLETCMDHSTSFLDRDYDYRNDDDNDDDDDDDDIRNSHIIITPLQAAIQTAEIFHGIIVGKDGVLLSQNETAEENLLGKIVKEGQSRQALKIERILDASDSGILDVRKGGKLEQGLIASVPQSQLLIVRGQFDDVNCLVTEGAEMLRKKKTLCWLPRLVLGLMSDYCSTKDVLNLSQSCKNMRQTMKGMRTVHGGRTKALFKTRRHRREPSKPGLRPHQK